MWNLIHAPTIESADAWAALDDVRSCGGTDEAADVLDFLLGPVIPRELVERVRKGIAATDAAAIEDLLKLARL